MRRPVPVSYTHLNWKEHLYDKVHLSVRTLDIIIGVLVALIFVFILLGMLKTRLG